MRGSTAFEEIDDPHDPAWVGHARVDGSSRRVAWIVGVIATVVIAGVSIAVLVNRDDSQASEPAAAPERTILPAVAPSSVVDLPDTQQLSSPDPAPAVAAATPEPSGSGWAPQVATRPSWSSRWLEGDLAGVSPAVTGRLEAVAKQLDRKIEVISGWRTTHEQADLYRRYQAGTGNLAAVPGTSMHESGRAADVYIDGVALANVDGATAIAASLGLHFPVGGEPWHVELMD